MALEFTFSTILIAIAKLLILMFIGYILYWRDIVNDKLVDMLSLVLIRVMVPALIISKTITHFSFAEYTYWWFLPFCAIVLSLFGMIIGAGVFRFLKVSHLRKEFICSCGFQNAGYLPMNLILFSFAGAMADRLFIHLFLFILGFNILMWSCVPIFLSGNFKNSFKIQTLLNPPVIATIFSLLWVAFLGKGSMPSVLIDPVKQLGQASFPLAMLTLGACLCRYRAYEFQKTKIPLIACVVIKLLLLPACVLFVLKVVSLGSDYKFFIFLESTIPTAVSLVIIGNYTGSDNKFFSGSILYTHLVSIFSIPLWLAVFRMVM